jgi:hypothetical protein
VRHPSSSTVWPCVLASALCFGSYSETMAGDPAGSLNVTCDTDPFTLGGLAPASSPPQFDDREGPQPDTALQANRWPSGPGPVEESPFGVIRASIFAKTDPAAWRPLPLRTLFSEGWNEPWIEPPSGSKGAPRQGWINAADGNLPELVLRLCLLSRANYTRRGRVWHVL